MVVLCCGGSQFIHLLTDLVHTVSNVLEERAEHSLHTFTYFLTTLVSFLSDPTDTGI